MARVTKPAGGKLAVFTICSNNYVPFAKTFLDSLRAHHPDADCYLVLADERHYGVEYPSYATVITGRELGIPDYDVFAFQYDIMEFNTALKPYAFLNIMDRDSYDAVLYFDPDIMVFQPLDAILDPIREGASFVLTPHLCQPAEGDVNPDDIGIMQAGIYNLGFCGCGTGEETRRLVSWWARRLRFQCINDQPSGIFVDQKFMDLIPGFAANAKVVRDTSLNVAYWNLSQRNLAQTEAGGWTVDGRPLTFFHFSGFDAKDTSRLSKHTELFSKDVPGPLASIIAHYSKTLIGNGYGTIPSSTYAFGRFASGTPIHLIARRLFREKFMPYDGNPFETFEAMLHRYAPGTARIGNGAVCTNYMRYFWDGNDWLRANFDISHPDGVRRFTDIYMNAIAHDWRLDDRLVEPVAARLGRQYPAIHRARYERANDAGVSVVGYLKTRSGVGEIGRLTLQSMARQGLKASGFDVGLGVAANRDDGTVDALLTPAIGGNLQVFNINADQLPAVMEHVAPVLNTDAYRVCMPFWELSRFPDTYVQALDHVDEVWAPSRFILNALAKSYRKPIIYMPTALRFEEPEPRPRSYFGLPENEFLAFYSFDFLSFPERKNPAGVLAAFRKAFPRRAAVRAKLVLKTMNSSARGEFIAAFKDEIANDPDVILIDRTLSRNDQLALMKCCNATLSLHRSEGLGLLIAESMALGIPVIATEYSAVNEFLMPHTGFPVEFKLKALEPGAYPHWQDQSWADPNTDHAAWYLRQLYNDPSIAAPLVAAAKAHIANSYGEEAVARIRLERLRAIGFSR